MMRPIFFAVLALALLIPAMKADLQQKLRKMKPIAFNLVKAVAAATCHCFADMKPWHNATRRKAAHATGVC
jgi:hypothetical protein